MVSNHSPVVLFTERQCNILAAHNFCGLFSDMGKNVIIDGMLVEREELKPHYRQVMEIFKDNPLDIVEVYCPLEICRERNIIRGNRYEM